MTGPELLEQAKKLVLCAEACAWWHEGLGGSKRYGLYLDVKTQKGYITWTILHNLILEGKIEKRGPYCYLVKSEA